jgi:hypothetical protein
MNRVAIITHFWASEFATIPLQRWIGILGMEGFSGRIGLTGVHALVVPSIMGLGDDLPRDVPPVS